MVKYYLAVDLGASSGRTIVGSLDNGKLSLKEMNRFWNGPTYTAVLLLVALVFYLQVHSKAPKLVTPTAEGQAAIAVASLDFRGTNEAGFARWALVICTAAGLGVVAYAVVAYFAMPGMVPTMMNPDVLHEKPIITFIITPLFNLVLSPFFALIAVFTSGAKRSMQGGSGGHSKEAQDVFRVAYTDLVSAFALLLFATVLALLAGLIALALVGGLT